MDHNYFFFRDTVGSWFDPAYYRDVYNDIKRAGVDPLRHYLDHGWREGRNPSRHFDTSYYLSENPDVREGNGNPLLHFVLTGAAEGRRPKQPPRPELLQIQRARPPCEQASEWLRPAGARTGKIGDLRRRLLNLGVNDTAGLVIALSHDDYTENAGGVQNCISDEAAIFRSLGWTYLHGCPAQPLPKLADELDGGAHHLILTVNGTRLGEYPHSELVSEIAALRKDGLSCWLVVHHLLGHSPELVTELAQIVGNCRTLVWIHDFFTLCPSWVLMRNDVAFCGAPPATSDACGICCYGGERSLHLARMQAFFSAVNPDILGPSDLALDFWRERGKLSHRSLTILPPCRVIFGDHPGEQAVGGKDRPLRVAFIGSTNYYKGWHVFDELAYRHRSDTRYLFYELSVRRHSGLPFVRHVVVNVGPETRFAMVEAIAMANIDVVILWSMCRETFSFTAHEAVAGGAAVMTRLGSGNILPALSKLAPRQVCALKSEQELFDSFSAGRPMELAAVGNRRRGALVFNGHTADHLLFPNAGLAAA